MTADPGKTWTTLGQLCATLWDSRSQPVVIQPGIEPWTVVTPPAPPTQCIRLQCHLGDGSTLVKMTEWSYLPVSRIQQEFRDSGAEYTWFLPSKKAVSSKTWMPSARSLSIQRHQYQVRIKPICQYGHASSVVLKFKKSLKSFFVLSLLFICLTTLTFTSLHS
jgi:hypothetical protein